MGRDRRLVGADLGEVPVSVLLGHGVPGGLGEEPESGRVLISGLGNSQAWVTLGLLTVGALWLVIWLWRAGDR